MIFVPILLFGQIINIPADYPTIQEGIDASSNGDTVLVQPGVYFENIHWDGKSITLASLFLTTQDPSYIEQTVIDANLMGAVMLMLNLDQDALLMGFTIRNGNMPDENGGGLRMNSASPVISDMIIRDNSANNGGGIFCQLSTLFLYNSSIINNVSFNRGGGIKIDASDMFIDNCIFEDNHAELSGALNYNIGGNMHNMFHVGITSCIIRNNSSDGNVSGVFIGRVGTNTLVDVLIDDCDFLANNGRSNGALLIMGDSLSFSLENSKFIGNTAEKFTAGASFSQSCDGYVINCLVAENIGGTDGGYYNTGGFTLWGGVEIEFLNCTFANNQNSYGGGMTVGPNSVAYTTNCIFRGNTNQQIALVDYDGNGGTAAIDYCNIEYGMDSISVGPNSLLMWGDHNTTGDPLFEGSGDDPYALAVGSPCIDGGKPDTIGMGLLPYDIIGNFRFWDGDENGSEIIDMGAYEFGAPVWVGIPESPATSSENTIIKSIYPNPGDEKIKINYSLENDALLQVYNITGKSVLQSAIKANHQGVMEVDFGHLAPGLYFVQIVSEQKSDVAKILIK